METSGSPAKQQFIQQVDNRFRASAPQTSPFDMSLVEFRDILDNDVQETFALLFRAPAETPAVQRTYQLTNDEMGVLDIFLVPTRKDDSGLYFEAIFNRLKKN